MAARILKSGPTNAIKRANYPRERGRERGSTCTRAARILSTCLTRTLEKRTRVTASARIRRTFVAKFTCLLVRSFFFFFFLLEERQSDTHNA